MSLIQKVTILRSLSQAAAYNQVFSFILLSSLWQMGETWEPNKTILFLPPQNNLSPSFLVTFHFHLLP
jgi:hypothetical protein